MAGIVDTSSVSINRPGYMAGIVDMRTLTYMCALHIVYIYILYILFIYIYIYIYEKDAI